MAAPAVEVLEQLPAHYRDVVVLRYLHDFSVAETGIILRMTDAKVRVTTHRAILKLREKWNHSEVKEGNGHARTTPIA